MNPWLSAALTVVCLVVSGYHLCFDDPVMGMGYLFAAWLGSLTTFALIEFRLHTVESVAKEISDGLDGGSFTLGEGNEAAKQK